MPIMTCDQARNLSRARVRAGAKLLDREIPEWRSLVDPEALELSEYDSCVLGQIGATFDPEDTRGLAYGHVKRVTLGLTDDLARRYGFELSLEDIAYGFTWPMLEDFWREELTCSTS